MKSLQAIENDNRLTSRDLGGICEWFVFDHGDLLACFVHEEDADEFVSAFEYAHSDADITKSQAKP